MALTQIDIDEDALAEAMRLSGAKTKKERSNVALREFAARHRRIAALEHYATLAAGWDFEGWEHRRTARKTQRRDPVPARLVCPVADPAGPRAAGGGPRSSPLARSVPSPSARQFRRSARTLDEYEQMSGMFDALYPDAALPQGNVAVDEFRTIPPAAAGSPPGTVGRGPDDLRHRSPARPGRPPRRQGLRDRRTVPPRRARAHHPRRPATQLRPAPGTFA